MAPIKGEGGQPAQADFSVMLHKHEQDAAGGQPPGEARHALAAEAEALAGPIPGTTSVSAGPTGGSRPREPGDHSALLPRIIETQRDIAAADLDLDAIMELVCERTQELTHADGSSILMLDGEELIHRAGTGFASGLVGERLEEL